MRARYGLTDQQRAVAYYTAAFVVTAFGFLGLASFGLPLLFIGVLLLALGPVRHRRDVLWPPLLGVGAFTSAFIALAPIACTVGPGATTRCTSALGWRIPGGIVAGLAASFAIGLGSALLLGDWLRRTGRIRA